MTVLIFSYICMYCTGVLGSRLNTPEIYVALERDLGKRERPTKRLINSSIKREFNETNNF